MNGAGSKAKGGNFERWSCKRLSLWISGDKRDDLYWRSAMSGGRATVQFKKGTVNRAQAGDISCIDTFGARLTELFLIECKHYKSLGIERLFSPGKATGIGAFWNRASTDAASIGKLPMLIAKQNFIEPFACLTSVGITRLRLEAYIIAVFPDRDMNFCLFEDLLKRGRAP